MDLILNDPCEHNFGGSWTQEKLSILKQYMDSYMNVMKKQPFSLIYIDAFAGTGERIEETPTASESNPSLFSPEDINQRKKFFDGSAKISLNLSRPFNEYWFIEKNQSRYEELCSLRSKYPHLSSKIHCEQGDANEIVLDILKKYGWKRERAILFLDPYGASVEYKTLVEIAQCKALDVWLLFPVGQVVNRLLMTKPENISPAWIEKLNRIFGSTDWREIFYQKEEKASLFEDRIVESKNAGWVKITDFYKKQLEKEFNAVANETTFLKNSNNNPLFAFIFAMTNDSKAAQNAALRIANHLLKPKGKTQCK